MAQPILVADDDRVTVQLLSSRLKSAGYNVVVAFDAIQAVMTAQRTPPAAILLDVNMPGGTGLEVLKRLKSSTKTSQVPVIVISVSTDPALPQTVKSLGAEEFLPKPDDFEQLQALLSKLLSEPPTAAARR